MLLAKPRLFKPLQHVAKQLAENNNCVKVVTYNILADKYATSG
jgi:mRNA deadenylase 3'-5' endonuclease subunit Ccr4